MSNLRGIMPASEYPSRETALALIAALESDQWDTSIELERLASELAGIEVDSFWTVAERCFQVYGYPELEVGRSARRLAEVSMRPSRPNGSPPPLQAPARAPLPASSPDTYGFQPRR